MSRTTVGLSAGRPSAKAKLADKEDTVRVNFDLGRAAHTKLKVYAAKQGKTVKDLLKAYVESLPEA